MSKTARPGLFRSCRCTVIHTMRAFYQRRLFENAILSRVRFNFAAGQLTTFAFSLGLEAH